MKKALYKYILILLMIFMVFSACDSKDEGTLSEWTIMIYMSGADLESGIPSQDYLGGAMSSDISEILSVASQPDDVNIIIETGGSTSWKDYNISSTQLSRYHVRDQQLILDATLPYESMGAASTYQSFLEWGITQYPAKHTGVILSGHGSLQEGYCADSLADHDGLQNEELRLATENAFAATNTDKLDFVAYCTCLSQIQDVADYNSAFYKYMLASQNMLSDEGFEYEVWLNHLYQHKDTLTILKSIVDSYFANINPLYIEHEMDNYEVLSILDLSLMPQYKQAFEDMARAILVNMQDRTPYEIAEFDDIISNETYFCPIGHYYIYDNYDVYDFLIKLENSMWNPGNNYINNAKSILDNMIVYLVKGREAGETHGLSFYYCNYTPSFFNSVKQNSAFTNWIAFLQFLVDTWGYQL